MVEIATKTVLPDNSRVPVADETDLGIYEDIGEGDDLTDTEDDKNRSLNSTQKQQKVSIVSVQDATLVGTDSRKNVGHKRTDPGVIRVSISGKVVTGMAGTRGKLPVKNEGIMRKSSSSSVKHVEMVANEIVDSNVADNNADRISVSTTCEGLRGKTCTPASMADTDWSELRDLQELESRIGVGSRQCSRPLFSRASDQASVVRGSSRLSTPHYFYISQQKPIPMTPLKAWRGFNGNVYFEPLHISKTFQPNIRRNKSPNTKSNSPENKTGQKKYKSNLAHRQFSVLDRKSVMNRENSRMPEDLQWIDGLEAAGSLRTEPIKKNRVNVTLNKKQICKGSVARSLSKGGDGKTLLSVSGDRYSKSQPFGPAPTRAQTQYSSFNQRLTTNSPDSMFPPLEQAKVSLRHIEQETGKETILHIIPPSDRFKYETMSTYINLQRPVHKYSPEFPSTARSSMMGN